MGLATLTDGWPVLRFQPTTVYTHQSLSFSLSLYFFSFSLNYWYWWWRCCVNSPSMYIYLFCWYILGLPRSWHLHIHLTPAWRNVLRVCLRVRVCAESYSVRNSCLSVYVHSYLWTFSLLFPLCYFQFLFSFLFLFKKNNNNTYLRSVFLLECVFLSFIFILWCCILPTYFRYLYHTGSFITIESLDISRRAPF